MSRSFRPSLRFLGAVGFAAAGIVASAMLFQEPAKLVMLPTGERIAFLSMELDEPASVSTSESPSSRRLILRYLSSARTPEERVVEADHAVLVAVEAADSLRAAAIIVEQHHPFIGRWTHFTTGYAFMYLRGHSGDWRRRIAE